MLPFFHGEIIPYLITQMFLRNFQYGIVVVAFTNVFVFFFAHHQHRRGIENPWNFGDCMKGRIRFMTTITLAYAHAYQATCLSRRMRAFLGKNSVSNARSTTSEKGNDFRGWAIYTGGGTRVVNGETLAWWSVISRFLRGRIDVMYGLFVTTEAHLLFSDVRAHSNNTAELTAMIEALSYLGPCGIVYFMILNTLLV